VSFDWRYAESEFITLSVAPQVTWFSYDGLNEVRDSTFYSIGVSARRIWPVSWQPVLNVSALGGREENDNDRPDLGRDLFGAAVDITVSPAPQWALNASGSFVRSAYLGHIPLLGMARRDDNYVAGIGALYFFTRQLSARVEAQYFQNDSNVALYQYDRYVVAAKPATTSRRGIRCCRPRYRSVCRPGSSSPGWSRFAALLASGAALAQAGRVVLAVGDVAAVRGADRVRLSAGATVGVGDAIVTGADGHAQIRFSDEALVAIKPGSEFRIEAYAFAGRADGSERAVFRLVRGGFRTLTGRIGQVNRDTYQVLTTQATIGIRGTHYQLEICGPGECRETPDEPPAAPGLYGGVYDGSVIATTTAASAIFASREFFVVPDGGIPARLIGPPSFLSSRLVGKQLAARSAPAEIGFRKVPEIPFGVGNPPWNVVQYAFRYQSTQDLTQLEPFDTPIVGIIGSDETTLEFAVNLGAERAARRVRTPDRDRYRGARRDARDRERRRHRLASVRRRRAQLGPLGGAGLDDHAAVAQRDRRRQRRRQPALRLRRPRNRSPVSGARRVRAGRRHPAHGLVDR
jgi:hypothetical protein